MEVTIRKGLKEDVPSLLGLIHELAAFEKASDEVEVTLSVLLADGFGANAIFEFYVAVVETEVVGIALYYDKYSTWKGRCLHLEDLVVSNEFKQQGIGGLLFEAVMRVAKDKKCKRMEWQVLDWNEPAIKFYKKYNAQLDGEWINCKFTEQQLNENVR